MNVRLLDGTELHVSRHAVDRYHERICPGLDSRGAFKHFRRLAALVGERTDRPAWSLADEQFHPETSQWVSLGPDIGLILRGHWVITVLCRGSVSETETRRRRHGRRGQKAAKAYARQHVPPAERGLARRRRRDDMAPDVDEAA